MKHVYTYLYIDILPAVFFFFFVATKIILLKFYIFLRRRFFTPNDKYFCGNSRIIFKFYVYSFQAKVIGLKTVRLDHGVKSVKIFSVKNHCLAFGHDGTYSVYEFDGDGQWKKIVTVNCSQWQTGGLIAAQIDEQASNILTLSYQGNFTCTSFK